MPNYSDGSYFFENETNLGLNFIEKTLNLKNFIKNCFKTCKISNFNLCFLSSVILHKLRTTASSDQHKFVMRRQKNINNISYIII